LVRKKKKLTKARFFFYHLTRSCHLSSKLDGSFGNLSEEEQQQKMQRVVLLWLQIATGLETKARLIFLINYLA
jgi:hypothetical protein